MQPLGNPSTMTSLMTSSQTAHSTQTLSCAQRLGCSLVPALDPVPCAARGWCHGHRNGARSRSSAVPFLTACAPHRSPQRPHSLTHSLSVVTHGLHIQGRTHFAPSLPEALTRPRPTHPTPCPTAGIPSPPQLRRARPPQAHTRAHRFAPPPLTKAQTSVSLCLATRGPPHTPPPPPPDSPTSFTPVPCIRT